MNQFSGNGKVKLDASGKPISNEYCGKCRVAFGLSERKILTLKGNAHETCAREMGVTIPPLPVQPTKRIVFARTRFQPRL